MKTPKTNKKTNEKATKAKTKSTPKKKTSVAPEEVTPVTHPSGHYRKAHTGSR